jgi:hypothetical protein
VLSFDAADIPGCEVREGDFVSFGDMFFGVVFKRSKQSKGIIHVVAYDQLRYLLNRDTYVYCGKRASDVIRMIALDYRLRLGEVEQTSYVIPYRIEDNMPLISIIENALDIELQNTGQRFVLFDEFGRLSLRAQAQMSSVMLINEDTIGALSFFSSIDNRCNRVKVSRLDTSSGQREVFVARDEVSENRIGVLQYYAKTADNEQELADKARALLALRNRDQRRLCIINAQGHAGVRAGCTVLLDLDDFRGQAAVLKCVHKFCAGVHLMDLEVCV